MPRTARTGFDKFFEVQMAEPSFAETYTRAREEIEAVDRMVRSLWQLWADALLLLGIRT